MRKENDAIRKRYEERCLHYRQYQYTARLDRIVLKMAASLYSVAQFMGLPLYRLLKQVVLKFMMNELELVFLANSISNSSWNVIKKEAIFENMRLIFSSPDIRNESFFKQIMYNMLMVGYANKSNLNGPEDMEEINLEMSTVIKDFKTSFENWYEAYRTNSNRINPKELKNISDRTKKKDIVSSYATLVESVLHICPPYNPDKKKKPEIIPKPPPVEHSPSSFEPRLMKKESEEEAPNLNLNRMQSDMASRMFRMDSRIDDFMHKDSIADLQN